MNRKCEPEMWMQTLNANANPKIECDIHETSVRHPMRHFFMPGEQTINGICMHCNILLNDNKSIPQTVFTNNNKMRTVWLLKTNSIPFMVDLVYILVQNSKFSLHIL